MTKNLFQSIITCASLLLISNQIHAQQFVDPYPLPTLNDGARVVLKNGDEIKGKWFGMTGTPKNLKNIQVKDESKTRHKLLTPDVDRVYITLSKMRQLEKAMDASTVTTTRGFIRKTEEVNKMASIVNLSQNWDELMKNNPEIVFDVVSEEEGKYGLRQLLNPGFDSKYRIYAWGQGATVMGKERFEYMLIDQEGEVSIVKNKDYAENFPKLFGDCSEFMESFDPDQVDISDMAFHLFLYTDMCK